MTDGFQYGDIIFLGLIAAFVALRLRSMLGRQSGIDPKDVWKQATRDPASDKNPPLPERQVKKTVSEEDVVPVALKENVPVATGLKAIRSADANFSTTDFISGAKLAFEWIVEAFSKGDKDKLRVLLSEERAQHFADAIDARGKDGLKHETTLVSVLATDITEAQMQGSRAQITVQFTSEQVSVTRDKDNHVVGGDLSAVEKVIDVWTFERDVSSRDPNWKITAT
jgi:predicted lipid-binding transport protein (Tim44 family)